ncbi:MAG: N-acetylmuramoyl-L-alanine amidase [Clostridia bacterium]|jgi:N-acetylmuramoyl-L-alanine amidase|nr:N-acetylmuramoyl-L-alanine amidase [Clostridia bacterium]
MNIEERLLTINEYSRSGEKQNKIEKIVVHWVGNAGSSAIANRNYFDNLSKTHTIYASSHYIIGLCGEIIKCIPEDEVAFHSGSHSMNRKSIGIETCHPDWEGKFNENTYNSLVELCVDICRRYNLTIDSIIRHYDVTGKECPRYYVRNEQEWIKFKNDVANKLGQATINVAVPEVKGDDEPVRRYKNGSTKEIIYADTGLTKVIGSLSPYEECDCFGIFENRPMVRYKIDGSNNYKIGFAKWTGGVR